ncbi:MAG: hypothetical protein ACLRSW_11955 [Christensenellaceae bacterium]
MNGEIVPILKQSNFRPKTNYLQTARYAEATVRSPRRPPRGKANARYRHSEVCTSERELLRYKGYADYKKGKRKKEAA